MALHYWIYTISIFKHFNSQGNSSHLSYQNNNKNNCKLCSLQKLKPKIQMKMKKRTFKFCLYKRQTARIFGARSVVRHCL